MPLTEQRRVQLDNRLNKLGFTYSKPLGAGAGGVIFLYTYSGTDPKILALCNPSRQIAIKLSETPDQQEKKIAEFFSALPQKTINRVNLIGTIRDKEGDIATLSQYETYKEKNKFREITSSSNLQEFLKNTFYPPHLHQKTSPVIQSLFKESPGIMLGQLTSSICTAQDQLHSHRILHLDTATKNFLINNLVYDKKGNIIKIDLKINDYDSSQILEPGSTTSPIVNIHKIPVKWTDTEGLTTVKLSIKTDLFARKATLIGMLGLTLQQVQRSEAAFFPAYSPSDNGTRLNSYLQNIKPLVETCPYPKQKEELKIYLECYDKYLTTVPNTFDLETARNEDRTLLLEANTLFVTQSYRKILADTANNHTDGALLLTQLQRLQGIEVDDKQLVDTINKHIEQLESWVTKDWATEVVEQEHRELLLNNIYVARSFLKAAAEREEGLIDSKTFVTRLQYLQTIKITAPDVANGLHQSIEFEQKNALKAPTNSSETIQETTVNDLTNSVEVAQAEVTNEPNNSIDAEQNTALFKKLIDDLIENVIQPLQMRLESENDPRVAKIFKSVISRMEQAYHNHLQDVVLGRQTCDKAENSLGSEFSTLNKNMDIELFKVLISTLEEKVPKKWHGYFPSFSNFDSTNKLTEQKSNSKNSKQLADIHKLSEGITGLKLSLGIGEKTFQQAKEELLPLIDNVIHQSEKTSFLVKIGLNSSKTAEALRDFKKSLNEIKHHKPQEPKHEEVEQEDKGLTLK